MRVLIQLFSVIALLFSPVFMHSANAQTALIKAHNDYRLHATRRHNDIHGAEQVYDDYRKNWLKRHNSEFLIGANGNGEYSDTPRCSRHDNPNGKTSRLNCGDRHIIRSSLLALHATDNYSGSTKENGAIGYLGYEYLFANDAFLGLGTSYGNSTIDHTLNGSTLNVKATEVFGHLVMGYILPWHDLKTFWNISVGQVKGSTTRNSTITGKYNTNGWNLSGVIEKSYQISPAWDMSLGVDYTFNRIYGASYTDSAAVGLSEPDGWNGDFTFSALFSKPLENGEIFFRPGASIELIGPTKRPFDATFDAGYSRKFSTNAAFSGTLGASVRQGGYVETRGSIRLSGKF